jgi:hypothetical protein
LYRHRTAIVPPSPLLLIKYVVRCRIASSMIGRGRLLNEEKTHQTLPSIVMMPLPIRAGQCGQSDYIITTRGRWVVTNYWWVLVQLFSK